MNSKNQTGLNIGTGLTYIPELINIGNFSKANIQIKLGQDRLPFEDDSIDFIFSYHALEHAPNYLFALSEIHRILKHGSLFLVGLPYVTSTKYHLVNPYHIHNFNEYSFDFFDPQKSLNGDKKNRVFFNKVFHRFHYVGIFNSFPAPIKYWCRHHLLNVVQKIDYGLIAVKDSSTKIPVSDKIVTIQKFDECLGSCIPYQD